MSYESKIEELIAQRDAMRAEISMLRTTLRQVAQAHAWRAFGECRSFGADVPLLSPSDVDAVARVALGEFREAPNVNSATPPPHN